MADNVAGGGGGGGAVKRMRAGSITGRLRTASDLEESGYINKTEKGVLKDLIISGDVVLQEALDKYERGDQSDIAIICKSLVGRRHSIDLLENLDLDFTFLANESGNYGADDLGVVGGGSSGIGHGNGGGIGGSSGGGSGGAPDPALQGRLSDFTAADIMIGDVMLNEGGTRGRRSSTIGSVDGMSSLFRTQGFDEAMGLNPTTGDDGFLAVQQQYHHQQQQLNAAGSGRGGTSTRRSNKSGIDPGIFDTQVDANAYAMHAQELMNSNGTSTRSGGRSAYVSRSSTGSSKRATLTSDIYGTANSARTFEQMFGTAAGVGVMWSRGIGPDGKIIGAEKGYVGAYSPEQRKKRIERFIEKRARRVWTKKVKVRIESVCACVRARVRLQLSSHPLFPSSPLPPSPRSTMCARTLQTAGSESRGAL